MNSAPSFNPDRPWESLPNPFCFATLAEVAKSVHQHPRYDPNAPSTPQVQRSSPVGRDWLGAGFQAGDLVLASSGGTSSIFEVDEIFLDDSEGSPYIERTNNLVINRDTLEVFHAKEIRRDPNYNRILTPVDPTWIGTHMGLVRTNNRNHWHLGHQFETLVYQSLRVRAKPFGAKGSPKKRSFAQKHLTVYGEALSRETLERMVLSKEVPLLNNLATKLRVS